MADSVSIGDSQFHTKCSEDRSFELPLRYVRGVRMHWDKGNSADRLFSQALRTDTRRDLVLARVDGESRTVRCGVVSLDEDRLTVEYEGQQRRIPRGRLAGIVFAATSPAPERTGHCRVHINDGSEIWGRLEKLEDATLHLAVFPGHVLEFPWDHVLRLSVKSERMVFASDLDPDSVEQDAIVTYPWSYRRDENVLGGPLRLGQKQYSRGLGVHAPCRLTFSLQLDYSTFAAVIGIDESSGNRGECIFRVLGDGKTLFEKSVQGSDRPHPVRVDVSGHRRVALAVEPGKNLDLADNANWCDARFIK